MPESCLITVDSPAVGVRVITLNRPQKRNALSKALIAELLVALSQAESCSETKAIVLTGAGNFFSAGADIKEIAEMDAADARSCRYLEDLCHGMAAVRKPLIAAVDGPALGGGFELAMMCDMIFASKRSHFALPEVKLGLIPGAGGTQRLTASLGKFKAMRTILMGMPITCDEAMASGLVCDTFDEGSVLEDVVGLATGLCSQPPMAVQMAKEAICRADGLKRDEEYERNLYYSAFGTVEKAKGVERFLTKGKSGSS